MWWIGYQFVWARRTYMLTKDGWEFVGYTPTKVTLQSGPRAGIFAYLVSP